MIVHASTHRTDVSCPYTWTVIDPTHPGLGRRSHGWITSSDRARTEGGMVSPSAFAVLKLMSRSNFVGCSMGRSAGFAPGGGSLWRTPTRECRPPCSRSRTPSRRDTHVPRSWWTQAHRPVRRAPSRLKSLCTPSAHPSGGPRRSASGAARPGSGGRSGGGSRPGRGPGFPGPRRVSVGLKAGPAVGRTGPGGRCRRRATGRHGTRSARVGRDDRARAVRSSRSGDIGREFGAHGTEWARR